MNATVLLALLQGTLWYHLCSKDCHRRTDTAQVHVLSCASQLKIRPYPYPPSKLFSGTLNYCTVKNLTIATTLDYSHLTVHMLCNSCIYFHILLYHNISDYHRISFHDKLTAY